ncbi:unnamed protein product [Amoebophrya sp. A25]|nr:unnamed protein product [Amoebophrya sp. A25]|eukprot:GSA25T00011026001.1
MAAPCWVVHHHHDDQGHQVCVNMKLSSSDLGFTFFWLPARCEEKGPTNEYYYTGFSITSSMPVEDSLPLCRSGKKLASTTIISVRDHVVSLQAAQNIGNLNGDTEKSMPNVNCVLSTVGG